MTEAPSSSAPDPKKPAEPSRPAESRLWRFWRSVRVLVAPVIIWGLLVGALIPPLLGWLDSEDRYDRAALREWLEEARTPDETLADLVGEYQGRVRAYAALKQNPNTREQRVKENGRADDPLLTKQIDVVVKREEIYQHLRAVAEPTKMYQGLLPLFPVVYQLKVTFALSDLPEPSLVLENGPRLDAPVVWDSGQQPGEGQCREESFSLRGHGDVRVRFQLRAENKRYRDDQRRARRYRQLTLLAVAATGFGLAWLLLVQSNERERERQRRLAQERISHTERALMQQERLHAETERQLLEQRLATQAAERQALELKSHLYASIGIMAGSYAHNIKNLLVRPNDLLRRCLETQGVPIEQEHMLREVQQTLGTVTERLQQILHTVRRDPSQYRSTAIDLNIVMRGIARTWTDLAAERWQLDVSLDLDEGPVLVSGDVSHLQQAIENLLFNARDATFEMRNQQRDAARKTQGSDPAARRQALIQAAAWRGKVVLRTRRAAKPQTSGAKRMSGEESILEVVDNGVGMSEEVKKRCTETHFSTKRDNALFEGHSTGMGLGLSFVVAILEHHQGKLEIDSTPMHGATFRARLPAMAAKAETEAKAS